MGGGGVTKGSVCQLSQFVAPLSHELSWPSVNKALKLAWVRSRSARGATGPGARDGEHGAAARCLTEVPADALSLVLYKLARQSRKHG